MTNLQQEHPRHRLVITRQRIRLGKIDEFTLTLIYSVIKLMQCRDKHIVVRPFIIRSPSRNASPLGGSCPRDQSPVPGSTNAMWSDENGSGKGTLSEAHYYSPARAGHGQRSPWSPCGSSSTADRLEYLGDQFARFVSLHSQSVSEFHGVRHVEEEVEKLRVCLLGHFAVGKTALVNQFMTSDYRNSYDASLGKYIYTC